MRVPTPDKINSSIEELLATTTYHGGGNMKVIDIDLSQPDYDEVFWDLVSSSVYPGLDRSPKKNWVEKAGGLPKLIERVAKHLHYEKEWPIGRSIATAVNWAKKMCSTGRAFGGKVRVGKKAQAAACKAVATWEAKKARAKADNSEMPDAVTVNLTEGYIEDDDGERYDLVSDGMFFAWLGFDLDMSMSDKDVESIEEIEREILDEQGYTGDPEEVETPEDDEDGGARGAKEPKGKQISLSEVGRKILSALGIKNKTTDLVTVDDVLEDHDALAEHEEAFTKYVDRVREEGHFFDDGEIPEDLREFARLAAASILESEGFVIEWNMERDHSPFRLIAPDGEAVESKRHRERMEDERRSDAVSLPENYSEVDMTIQMPLDFAPPESYGRSLYWKRIIKYGKFFHPSAQDGVLNFDQAYAEGLVQNFNAGAFESVPLYSVDLDNQHNSLPDRIRGEIKRVEAREDGLYALVETNAEGTYQLEERSPNIGCSVRIRPGYTRYRDMQQFGDSLEHLALTPKSHLGAMGAWMKTEEANLSEQDSTILLDLTEAEFYDLSKGGEKDMKIDWDNAKKMKISSLKEGDRVQIKGQEHVVESVEKDGNTVTLTTDKRTLDGMPASTELKAHRPSKGGEKDMAEFNLAEMDFSALTEDEKTTIMTGLGIQDVIDNAIEPYKVQAENSERVAKEAFDRYKSTERALAEEKLDKKLSDLSDAGVPPAAINAAKPILLSELAQQEITVDMTEGDNPEPVKGAVAEQMWKVLEQQKGTVPVEKRTLKGEADLTETSTDDADYEAFKDQIGDFVNFQD